MKILLRKTKKVEKFQQFKEFHDFFWAPNTLCLTLGFDFNQTLSSKWKPLLYLLTACELTMHIYTRSNLLQGLCRTIIQRDLQQISSAATFVIYGFDSNMKLSSLLYHRKLLLKTYNILKTCYPLKPEELSLYRVNEHHGTSAKPVLIVINYITVCLIIVGPLLESVVTYVYDWLVLPADELQFIFLKPFPVKYSFDYTRSAATYLLVYVIEVVNSVFTIHSLLAADMWLLCLTAQIIMHFQYIAKRLESYKPCLENEVKDCKFLTDIIEKHQMMLNLYENLNVIFGLSLATNLFTTSFLLCCVAVQLTVHEIGIYFLKYCMFQITVVGNFYMIYSYGERLTTSSADIAEAAYKSQWYNGSRAYKKLLLTLITRAQKQAELTTKGYQKISLSTFQSVMGMSYRVFTLLQSVIDLN